MDEEFLGIDGFAVTRGDHGNKDEAINIFVELGGNAAIDLVDKIFFDSFED